MAAPAASPYNNLWPIHTQGSLYDDNDDMVVYIIYYCIAVALLYTQTYKLSSEGMIMFGAIVIVCVCDGEKRMLATPAETINKIIPLLKAHSTALSV